MSFETYLRTYLRKKIIGNSSMLIRRETMKKIFMSIMVVSLFSVSLSLSGTVYSDEIESNEKAKNFIANKMINSIDYFEKIEISFREKYGNLPEYEYIIHAKADFEKGILHEEYQEIVNEKEVSDYHMSVFDRNNDNEFYSIDMLQRSYLKGKYEHEEPGENKKDISSRLIKYDDKFVMDQRSSSLPLSMSADSIFSQQYATQLLSDFSSWSIKGSEFYLERDALVLSGAYPEDLGLKLKADTFEMYVDSNTGVLLSLEGFKDGVITNYLKVDSINYDSMISLNRSTLPNLGSFEQKVIDNSEEIADLDVENVELLSPFAGVYSYVVDNDPLPGQGAQGSSNYSWISNSAALNGEERYTTTNDSFYFWGYKGAYPSYKLQAYLCSPRATATAAEYWGQYGKVYFASLNQNLASCGWNTFKSKVTYPLVPVNAYDLGVNVMNKSRSVADGMNFIVL